MTRRALVSKAPGARALLISALALALGCASAKVGGVQDLAAGEVIPRPDRVLVYNFATTPDEVELNRSPMAVAEPDLSDESTLPKEQKVAYAAAEVIAHTIYEKLGELGLRAERYHGPPPETGSDLSVEGQFVDINEGSRLGRMVIGFGVGATSMSTHVELFSIRSGERQLVTDFHSQAEGSKKPGLATPLGVGAATGNLVVSAAVGATIAVASEVLGPLAKDAKNTGEQIAEQIGKLYVARGWLPASALD